MSLISLQNLSVQIAGVKILENISLEIGREKFGLVGESGSGKSMLARALLGVLPLGAKLSADRLCYKKESLLNYTNEQWRALRGKKMAMILQDAKSSLNPLMKIKKQLREVQKNITCLEALKKMRLSDAERVLNLYPFQLSGGMAQRVMIAMMLMQNPEFLIADEITSSLDFPLQKEILNTLQNQLDERQMGLLYISHDIEQTCNFCSRIAVLKDGKLLAIGSAAELRSESHPYIRKLFAAILTENRNA